MDISHLDRAELEAIKEIKEMLEGFLGDESMMSEESDAPDAEVIITDVDPAEEAPEVEEHEVAPADDLDMDSEEHEEGSEAMDEEALRKLFRM